MMKEDLTTVNTTRLVYNHFNSKLTCFNQTQFVDEKEDLAVRQNWLQSFSIPNSTQTQFVDEKFNYGKYDGTGVSFSIPNSPVSTQTQFVDENLTTVYDRDWCTIFQFQTHLFQLKLNLLMKEI